MLSPVAASRSVGRDFTREHLVAASPNRAGDRFFQMLAAGAARGIGVEPVDQAFWLKEDQTLALVGSTHHHVSRSTRCTELLGVQRAPSRGSSLCGYAPRQLFFSSFPLITPPHKLPTALSPLVGTQCIERSFRSSETAGTRHPSCYTPPLLTGVASWFQRSAATSLEGVGGASSEDPMIQPRLNRNVQTMQKPVVIFLGEPG